MKKSNNKIRKLKFECRGITLIALVVTIIILIILAGISINLVLGEKGIITKTRFAKEETIIGREKEAIGVGYTACQIKKQMTM